VTFTDSSALKQASAALAASERTARERLAEIELVYASAPVGLCVLDRELRFVRINERLAEINGYPAEAHIGKSVREIVPALADQSEPLMQRGLQTGEPLLDVEISGETPAQPSAIRHWVES
jgi:PAS domain-containing protein